LTFFSLCASSLAHHADTVCKIDADADADDDDGGGGGLMAASYINY
jgi:hypothetical protein